MLAQLEEDLVHLERGGDRLDEHGRAHRAERDAEGLLRVCEDVVPESRLEVALELRQVVERSVAVLDELVRGVEEMQPEVDERPRPALAVHEHVLLGQVPAARPGDDRRAAHVGAERVRLALWRRVGEGAARGIAQVQHAADDVGPGRGRGVLEVGEPHPRARVQRVDRHLRRRRRPGDLDAAIDEGGRRRRHEPVAVADAAGRRCEVQPLAAGDPLAALMPCGEQP